MFDDESIGPQRPTLTLLGVPVTILPWHFILLAILFASEIGRHPGFGLALVVLGSASILAHEMGHALTSQAFGLQPRVVLSGFGGFTQHLPSRRPLHEFVIVAAGPAVNLLLWQLLGRLQADAMLILPTMAAINLWWAIYNLLPMFPLDGGRLIQIVLHKLIRRPAQADRWTMRISLGMGVLVLAWAIWLALAGGGGGYGLLFPLLVGRRVYDNWLMLQSIGESAEERFEQKHERVRELLAQARQAYERGQFGDTVRLCHLARAEPYVSKEETDYVWHLLALASAQLGDWEAALRYAQRLPESKDMAAVAAAALLALADRERIRKFLASPTVRLLPDERQQALQDLARD